MNVLAEGDLLCCQGRRWITGQGYATLADKIHRPLLIVTASVGHSGQVAHQSGQGALAFQERFLRLIPLGHAPFKGLGHFVKGLRQLSQFPLTVRNPRPHTQLAGAQAPRDIHQSLNPAQDEQVSSQPRR